MRRAAVLLCALLAAPVAAQTDPVARASQAAALLAEAETALAGAGSAPDRIAALTDAVRGFEAGLEAVRESARQAVIREEAITARLAAEQARLGALLGVLQTLDQTPPPALLLHPEGPLSLARAEMMVSDVTPAVAAEAEALRATLQELSSVRMIRTSASAQLEGALRDIQAARVALAEIMAERVRLPEGAAPDPVLLGVLSASSRTLEDFAAGLADIPAPPAPLTDFASLRGALPLPVAARVLRRFGEADLAGIARPGLVLAAPAQALVTAPFAATVRYTGTLLDYGNVIVLEPQTGVLLILAGLDALYVDGGDVLAPGAPLGLMGGDPAQQAGFASGQTRQETLYLELRESGAPVDPADWFVTDKD
ncbi:peptidoglycan DD-metalloendopeptidase family protein [Dinoroseobacter sp. PD6]|uniref:murein hydrolase activator EnvC family protein n=1 Tax=Dinoroseobacter sp. PD6 TaxID=3028384 RepID=UPI00237C4D1F|nr:peptidoglycan DD-metalloendopeptidase family protein [Dinoroseobacter sp. PD6]MDD9717229.1 peptidoglycan DD-metalloendopeptidase family protein [Dinoroseobacter sp. PD6]